MASNIQHNARLTDKLPSSKELDRLGTNGMLALIHDAIGHLVGPVSNFPKVMPVLERVADVLIKQQAVLEEVLAVRRDAVWERLAAGTLEGAPSLSHSVLKRDLSFVLVSESYCHLFDFSAVQFQRMCLKELIHPADLPRFSRSVKVLLEGEAESCEMIHWRISGSHRFLLTRDTFWGIGRHQGGGPQYFATVSEKIADQDDAARLVERAGLKIGEPGNLQGAS
jgi:hypothetical protein